MLRIDKEFIVVRLARAHGMSFAEDGMCERNPELKRFKKKGVKSDERKTNTVIGFSFQWNLGSERWDRVVAIEPERFSVKPIFFRRNTNGARNPVGPKRGSARFGQWHGKPDG